MNNPVKIDPALHDFIAKDRARLFTERNHFKYLSEKYERELAICEIRDKYVINILIFMITLLIGVVAYVT